jgi:hypothetical protein
MKIKINQKLLDALGKEIVNNATPLTLKDVCIGSILTPIDGDDEKKKFEKYLIYKKLRDATDEADLTIEDLAIIKKGIGKFQPPLILGQCFELLEG